MSLFSPGDATDQSYLNVRDSADARIATIREHTEQLWVEYECHADPHFLTECRRDFHARFWEMYLVVTLMRLGHKVTCPKPGPDAGIVVEGRRIWFEAVAPKPGADGAPDRVPEMRMDEMNWVPNEQIILRYLNAVRTKLTEQYPRWREAGIVAEQDALVIAVNPKEIAHELVDTIPPRIVQVAFPIGPPTVSLEGRSGKVLEEVYQRRVAIPKANGAVVPTGAFLHDTGVSLSGLLCSRVDVANYPAQLGAVFQFVPNPLARAQVPEAFRLPGTYFPVARDENGLIVNLR